MCISSTVLKKTSQFNGNLKKVKVEELFHLSISTKMPESIKNYYIKQNEESLRKI